MPGSTGCGKTQLNCHSEEPAGDEESRIALKTRGARSFAAAQDDSILTFFRSLFSPALHQIPSPPNLTGIVTHYTSESRQAKAASLSALITRFSCAGADGSGSVVRMPIVPIGTSLSA